MLVVKSRGGGEKRYRYGRSGIFDTLSRKLFSSGVKNVISTAAKSAIGQKVTIAVVNGASSATQKAVKSATNDSLNNRVKPYLLSSTTRSGKKRSATTPSSSSAAAAASVASPLEGERGVKKSKIDINSLINGSGIVLD